MDEVNKKIEILLKNTRESHFQEKIIARKSADRYSQKDTCVTKT